MTAPGKALEALAALEVREAQAARLRHALARSLALEGLWPGVFQIRGGHKVKSVWRRSGHNLILIIRASNSTEREYLRPQVPEILRSKAAEADALDYIRRTVPQRAARFLQGKL